MRFEIRGKCLEVTEARSSAACNGGTLDMSRNAERTGRPRHGAVSPSDLTGKRSQAENQRP